VKKHIKLVLLWILRACGLFRIARRISGRGFFIVGWHGVSLSDEHTRFDRLFVSPQTLRRRLDYLKKHFKIISLEEALRQHQRGKIEPHQVVLTFDDAYYNFKAVTAPILREYEAPATVYIVSEAMVSQQPVPNLLLRDVLLSTSRSEPSRAVEGFALTVSMQEPAGRKRLIRKALDHFKALPDKNGYQAAFVEQMADAYQVDISERIRNRVWHSISSREARMLADEGFSMQLHSHRHVHVVDQDEHELLDDVVQCRTTVEQATGREAADFCYPSGLWTRAAWPALEAANIRSAVTVRMGPNFPDTPRLALRRVLDGEDCTQLEFEFDMSGLRWLLHCLRHPDRRHVPSEASVKSSKDGSLF